MANLPFRIMTFWENNVSKILSSRLLLSLEDVERKREENQRRTKEEDLREGAGSTYLILLQLGLLLIPLGIRRQPLLLPLAALEDTERAPREDANRDGANNAAGDTDLGARGQPIPFLLRFLRRAFLVEDVVGFGVAGFGRDAGVVAALVGVGVAGDVGGAVDDLHALDRHCEGAVGKREVSDELSF